MQKFQSVIGGCICFGLILVVTACIAVPSYSTSTADGSAVEGEQPVVATAATAAEVLIFNEEFLGTKLNTDYWDDQLPWGRINDPELQYYSPDSLKVDNGFLRITADRKSVAGKEYTSGVINSSRHFTFTYGYLEMRGRIPSGRGLWPAFWLYVDKDDGTGEIDVFEFLGHEPNIVHMAYHFPELQQFWFNGPDYSQDYHTYAIDWQPDHIAWYVDGVERARATNAIPNEPMYIILNLAVGGPWPGNPDEHTKFPAHYDIDYIRLYQNKK